MSRIARELLDRAGVDVDVLIQELTAAARTKVIAHYRYTILHASLAGVADKALLEVLMDVRTEHGNHFDALVTRIYELDGRLPDDLGVFTTADTSTEDLLSLVGESPDALVNALLGSGWRTAPTCTRLRELTRGKDHRTHRLAEAILFEESEHEAWFHEFLGTGSPARFQRGFRGRSPYLSRLPPTDSGE